MDQRLRAPEKQSERFHIAASAGWLAVIDEWAHANRVPSRAEAVRRLVAEGLKATSPNTDLGVTEHAR